MAVKEMEAVLTLNFGEKTETYFFEKWIRSF